MQRQSYHLYNHHLIGRWFYYVQKQEVYGMAEKKELRIKLNLSNQYELDKVINGWMGAIQKMEAENNYECTLLEIHVEYD